MRLVQLDGLRGLAVLLVVAGHVAESVVPYGGVVGVTTFFVLSGFVITRALLDEAESNGRIALGAFWIRRAARLLPAWIAMTTVTVAAVLVLHDPIADDLGRVLAYVTTYTGNVARVIGVDVGPFEHTWSLAVEEQFYLVWPLLLAGVLVLSRRHTRSAVGLLVALIGGALVWRAVATVIAPYDHLAYSLDTCAAALLLGAATAIARRTGYLEHLTPKEHVRPSLDWRRWVGAGAVAGLVVLATCTLLVGPGSLPGAARWVESAAVPVAAAAVACAAAGRVRVLEVGLARWFGTVSYGLYLWHYPLLRLRPWGVETTGPMRLGLAVVAIAVAAASWYLLERPVLRAVRRRMVRAGGPNPMTTPRPVPATASTGTPPPRA